VSKLIVLLLAMVGGCVRSAPPPSVGCVENCAEWSCKYDSHGAAKLCECMD
jgi:hypothetical protein